MKIAVCGKGGVGKTTISGLLCRILAQGGHKVLAIDGDPNPNLSHILGVSTDTPMPPSISTKLLEIVEEPEGKRYAKLGVPLQEVIDTYGLNSPDNVTLLAIGQPDHAGTGCMCGAHSTVREIIHSALEESEAITILDTEASLEQMKRGTSKYVDMLMIVVEPYYRSLEAASRFQRLGAELGVKKIIAVANKVKNKEDEKAIRQYCKQIQLPLEEIIPYDDEIVAADQSGKSILDFSSSSSGLGALRKLAERIMLN